LGCNKTRNIDVSSVPATIAVLIGMYVSVMTFKVHDIRTIFVDMIVAVNSRAISREFHRSVNISKQSRSNLVVREPCPFHGRICLRHRAGSFDSRVSGSRCQKKQAGWKHYAQFVRDIDKRRVALWAFAIKLKALIDQLVR